MKMRTTVRQKALPMALAFLLATFFAVIIPAMKAEADGGGGIVFTDDCDLDQKVDQAKLIVNGSYKKTDGELISAKYPAGFSFDDETYTQYITVSSGEGYFFRLDLPANTVAFVNTNNQGEGGTEYAILGYQVEPSDPDATQYDYSVMKNTLGLAETSYEESEFVFVNPDANRVTKCFLFVPKNSVTDTINIRYETIVSVDGRCVYMNEAGAPDQLKDKLDKALRVSKGSAVDLSQAESIEVCATTGEYYGIGYTVRYTAVTKGKLLEINGGDDNIRYMSLKDKADYNIYEVYSPDEDVSNCVFAFNRYDRALWIPYAKYIFLSEDAEFDQWSEDAPAVDLSSMLKEDKVNIVSWDDDLQQSLKQVFTVYPELQDKVNYINLGMASSETASTRKEIAKGRYDGYTILAAMDVGEVDMAKDFQDLAELGLTASDYSDSYAFARKKGTFDGKLKAVAWHVCPNGFFYNAAIAKKVLGTDDPEKVQEMISTPAKFNDVAKKMKAAGYYMTSGAFLNESEKEFYKDYPQDNMFAQIVNLEKTYDAASYDTRHELWSEEWSSDMVSGNTFGFFGTVWMKGVFSGNGVPNGTFKLCEGPISYYWGGTFLAAKDLGTQKDAALALIKGLTCDANSMEKIETKRGDFVNNKKANQSIAAKSAMADGFYAGNQDPTIRWHNAALTLGGEGGAPVSVANAKVELSATTFTYNGKVQKPSIKSVTVNGKKLVSGTDYTVTWQNANPKNAGTYTLTINGKGSYKESKKVTFKINAKKITPTVTLSKKSFVFNGKVQKPKVTVKDGTTVLATSNYTVKFASGCKKAGTYKITVTLKGNYSGTKTVSYSITKKANPLKVKAKAASVSLAKLKKADQSLAITKAVTFAKKGQGTMVYAKKSGSAKISINKKTGKITVAKGLKKGAYTIKITVKAKGNANYKASKAIPLTIKIVVK